jgi:single-strand DNA-binding protein
MSAPITLTGRIGADPELRFAATGTAIVNLRVVTDERRKDATTGEWTSVNTTWWSVSAFKQLAENVAESLSKGDLVIVVGKVKSREWETKEGEKRTAWEVDAQAIGPDLSRATATVNKGATRAPSGLQQAENDPWASKPATTSEPPF